MLKLTYETSLPNSLKFFRVIHKTLEVQGQELTSGKKIFLFLFLNMPQPETSTGSQMNG